MCTSNAHATPRRHGVRWSDDQPAMRAAATDDDLSVTAHVGGSGAREQVHIRSRIGSRRSCMQQLALQYVPASTTRSQHTYVSSLIRALFVPVISFQISDQGRCRPGGYIEDERCRRPAIAENKQLAAGLSSASALPCPTSLVAGAASCAHRPAGCHPRPGQSLVSPNQLIPPAVSAIRTPPT